MAYEPKTWVCGETITAEALNHIEGGLAECCESKGALGILATYDEATEGTTLNKTWQEIYEAVHSGVVCSVYQISDNGAVNIEPIVNIWSETDHYVVTTLVESDNPSVAVALDTYSTTSANGYPAR